MQNHVPLGHCLGFKWHGDSTSTISYSKMLYEEVWSIYSFQCPTKIKPWWTFNEAVSIALLYFSFLYSYSLVFPPNHRNPIPSMEPKCQATVAFCSSNYKGIRIYPLISFHVSPLRPFASTFKHFSCSRSTRSGSTAAALRLAGFGGIGNWKKSHHRNVLSVDGGYSG